MKNSNDFHYKKNRLQQIKGFCYAVNFSSISIAAKHMNLTQSTVSLQIQSLERDLGFQLFKRNSKPLALTQDGKNFYELSCPLLYQFESVVELFLEDKKTRSQKSINIAVHHIAISCLMPKIIAAFKNQYPDCKIILRNIPPNEAIARLKSNEVDLAFYPSIEHSAELECIKMKEYKPILIMNKNHFLAKKNINNLKDLKNCDLIRIDKHLITLPLFEEALKAYGLKGSIEFENGSWEMLKAIIKENNCVAVISELCLDKNDDELISKDLSDFFPTMRYDLIYKKGKIFNQTTKDFIEIFLR